MITFSLQSGSNGNAIYVEADGAAILFDAGISGRQAALRLAHHGRDAAAVKGLVISHNHSDHVRCAAIYRRKFGMEVWTTRKTQAAAPVLGQIDRVHYFRAGRPFRLAGLTIHTIPTRHDAADGVAFVIEHDGAKLGILTDLGHAFPKLAAVIADLDALYLESNYDPQMLAEGPYPQFLKDRVRGPGGHLSNREAAELLHQSASDRLQWVALAHLSHFNNTPALASRTHRHYLGPRLPIHIATRYEPSDLLHVHPA